MNRQTDHDRDMLLPSLRDKLQAFADGLTSEEWTQLRSLRVEDVTGMLSPSLRQKAQRAGEGLTTEERAQLDQLVQDTVAGTAPDTQGHMRGLYEGDHGWKGPPGTDPELNQVTGGGAGLVAGGLDRYSLAFLAVVILGTAGS